jgi:hypothetical protein
MRRRGRTAIACHANINSPSLNVSKQLLLRHDIVG